MGSQQYYSSSNQGRRSYLNPLAQEFRPIFHSFSTTMIIPTSSTTNNICYYYNNYHPNINNFPNYYYYSSLPTSVQLPRHTTIANYQNYPSFDHHHNHNHSLMQSARPQLDLGQSASPPSRAHVNPDGPSPMLPKSPTSHRSEHSGARRWGCGRASNCERKQGLKCNYNEDWSKGSKNSSCQMNMPVKPDGRETTAMIRNIPNLYTRKMLIKFLDDFCRFENQKLGSNDDHQPLAFDFLYLPMDFKRDANKGYAFVNFTHPMAFWKLYLAFSNRGWEHCKSSKICTINCAAIQGKERLVEHFRTSKFRCSHEDYLPVCFTPPRDGSGASVIETTIGQHLPLSPPYIEK